MIQILRRESSKAESAEPETTATTPELESGKPDGRARLSLRDWRFWVACGGGALTAVIAMVVLAAGAMYRGDHAGESAKSSVTASETAAPSEMAAPVPGMVAERLAAPAEINGVEKPQAVAEGRPAPAGAAGGTSPASGPMIARTVSLAILVKNVAEARSGLDAILDAHHGYAAQLTISTPEAGARSFRSSLRIPATELASALDALRALGRVQTETQSGEEVTAQHADLEARLTNARETEARLRQILNERTGKMQDVLDVEEKIAETRGEIEQMEAAEKALVHRVDFATVELELAEEYRAQLTGNSESTGMRMRNSLVAGIGHAGSSLLGLVLFAEEFGPVMLIWVVILGTPVYLVWRYRRARREGL